MTDKPKILVVDDEENTRKLLNMLLTGEGYEVALAKDGKTAFRMVRENEYDIAFIDILMPGIDGFETLLEIKRLKPKIKVVIITAYLDKKKIEETEMIYNGILEGIITKPFNKQTIRELLKKLREESSQELRDEYRKKLLRGHILIIDDNESAREGLSNILKLKGYTVYCAGDGETGLEIFQQENPEIAIVDIKMPGIGGIEVLEKIKEKSTEKTEVIMITGFADTETAIQAVKKGAFDYIRKPLDYEELEITIRRALGKQKIQRSLDLYLEISKGKNRELKELKEYVNNIIKSMADSLIVTDTEGKIEAVNQTTLDLLGYREDEIIDQPIGILLAEEEEEEELLLLEKILNGEVLHHHERFYRTKEGVNIPVSFSSAVMNDEEKKPIGIVNIARDMREIKRLMEKEKELAAAQRAVTIIEGIGEGITLLELDGRIRQVNSEFERRTGWKREEVIGKTTLELGITSAEDFGRLDKELIPKLMQYGSVRNGEMTVTRKDGTEFTALFSWTLIKDAEGKPSGIISAAMDITQRKKTEEALKKSEEKLREEKEELEKFTDIAVGRELKMAEMEKEIKRLKEKLEKK